MLFADFPPCFCIHFHHDAIHNHSLGCADGMGAVQDPHIRAPGKRLATRATDSASSWKCAPDSLEPATTQYIAEVVSNVVLT